MLVLSRRKNQIIRLNDDIAIKVMRIKGGKVRLSIDAPQSVVIWREEIYQRIKQEQESSPQQEAAAG